MTDEQLSAVLPRYQGRIRVEPTGCWIWTGARSSSGYGSARRLDGTYTTAHRLVYEQVVGPVPEGLQLDHLCRIPLCCRPDHLEPVTPRVNIARSTAPQAEFGRRDECSAGHPYTAESLYVTPTGARQCRVCKRARSVAYRAARRAV